ncbi:cell division protein FtsI [Paenibacillus donghaensis]|uniref:Cell division protein FtsI n=2 Tax=Paenibacillus donghaensis TaxID=414771 RepID=A0A2Z2KKD0_9BACL|nr:cell division protein FtsI [Paenibacillus donghaensis]
MIFCIIIIRLASLQFAEGASLADEETKRDVKTVPLAAARGVIYAANGEKLAYSSSVQSLYMMLTKEYTAKVKDKEQNKDMLTDEARQKSDALAARLAAEFAKYSDPAAKQLSKEGVLDALDLEFKRNQGYVPRRIKADLSQKEIAYFMEHKDEYPGLSIVEENLRHYNNDTIAVQTVGYVKPFKSTETGYSIYTNIRNAMKQSDADPGLVYKPDESVGADGLELQYQRELRGKNGYQEISVDPQNMAKKVEKLVPPVKGYNIWSTINKNIQLKTEQAVTDQIKWLHSNAVQGKTHPDAQTGYAVAMEVDTGNVVAMANMPDYDTNIWTGEKLLPEDWEKIETNYQNGTVTPKSSGRSGNDFESVVFLGSTIKPLSVLIGLNEGLFSTTETYNDKGIAYFGKDDKSSVRNSSGHVYNNIRPAKAIEFSSNAFMIDMVGERLYNKYKGEALNVWDSYLKQFGLGVSTESGLPKEYPGEFNYRREDYTGTDQAALVYASFGQQGKFTPLQLAQYTATLANEGERIKPQLVSRITDADGKLVKSFEREVLNKVEFDPAYWSVIKQGMNSKVEAFDDFPYDFARKTGTSEQWSSKARANRDNGVFIAYAPRDKPKLAVAVVIPDGGFGSQSAAPVARKIFDAYDWEYGLDGIPKKSLAASSGETE